MPAYPKLLFRRFLRNHADTVDENADLLLYLVYLDYMKLLCENPADSHHQQLLKQYRG